MTIDQLKWLKETALSGGVRLPFTIRSKSILSLGRGKPKHLVVNHFVALPIFSFASAFDPAGGDVTVKTETGDEIGALCFCRELGEVQVDALTDKQFLCYLIEASDYSCAQDGTPYSFRNNYLLVHASQLSHYLEFHSHSAAIWGRFSHDSAVLSSYHLHPSEIVINDVIIKHPLEEENANRAIIQTHSLERFLKYYHLLEMRFDLSVIDKIKQLDIEQDAHEIGDILKSYGRDDWNRLTDIISECQDINSLQALLERIDLFPDKCKEIFYRFGKDKNPIKEISSFNQLIGQSLNLTNLRAARVSLHDHAQFIKSLAAYYIYRVRCSIAHSKIGEYPMGLSDEEFVVKFAEPLLLEVISQVFRR